MYCRDRVIWEICILRLNRKDINSIAALNRMKFFWLSWIVLRRTTWEAANWSPVFCLPPFYLWKHRAIARKDESYFLQVRAKTEWGQPQLRMERPSPPFPIAVVKHVLLREICNRTAHLSHGSPSRQEFWMTKTKSFPEKKIDGSFKNVWRGRTRDRSWVQLDVAKRGTNVFISCILKKRVFC